MVIWLQVYQVHYIMGDCDRGTIMQRVHLHCRQTIHDLYNPPRLGPGVAAVALLAILSNGEESRG